MARIHASHGSPDNPISWTFAVRAYVCVRPSRAHLQGALKQRLLAVGPPGVSAYEDRSDEDDRHPELLENEARTTKPITIVAAPACSSWSPIQISWPDADTETVGSSAPDANARWLGNVGRRWTSEGS
jgi:hypothetical protein